MQPRPHRLAKQISKIIGDAKCFVPLLAGDSDVRFISLSYFLITGIVAMAAGASETAPPPTQTAHHARA